MCGIAGIYSIDEPQPIDRQALMTRSDLSIITRVVNEMGLMSELDDVLTDEEKEELKEGEASVKNS